MSPPSLNKKQMIQPIACILNTYIITFLQINPNKVVKIAYKTRDCSIKRLHPLDIGGVMGSNLCPNRVKTKDVKVVTIAVMSFMQE